MPSEEKADASLGSVQSLEGVVILEDDSSCCTEPTSGPQDPETQEEVPAASTKRDTLLAYVHGYCENTSVHGFSYLVGNTNLCERTFWALLIVAGLILSSLIINQAFQ